MVERDSYLPLVAGVAVAVLLHVHLFVALPVLYRSGGNRAAHTLVLDDSTSAESPEKHVLELGRDRAVVNSSVAWIPYDDVRDLLARRDVTEQPAVQMAVDPVDKAPPRLDATPPAPDPQPASPTSASLAQMAVPSTP